MDAEEKNVKWVMEELVNEYMQKWKYINFTKFSQFVNNSNCQQAIIGILKIRQKFNLRIISLSAGYNMYKSTYSINSVWYYSGIGE